MLEEKVCEPSEVTAVSTSFCSTDSKHELSAALDQTCTTFRRNFFDHSSSQKCFSWDIFVGYSGVKSFQCHSKASLSGLKSGLSLGSSKRQIFCAWNHSVVDLLWCLGSPSCSITQLPLSFKWPTTPKSWWSLHHTSLLGCFDVDKHKILHWGFYILPLETSWLSAHFRRVDSLFDF